MDWTGCMYFGLYLGEPWWDIASAGASPLQHSAYFGG
jgi:hypothetical protein